MNYEEITKIIKQANEEQTNKLAEVNKAQIKLLKEELKNIIKDVNSKIDNTSQEVTELKKRNIRLERKIRENNIVIFGIVPTKQNLLHNTLSKLNTVLGLSIRESDINKVYTIGQSQKSPIILEFLSNLKKQELLKELNKLKGTGISIANDLSVEDRQEQKVLRYYQKKHAVRN